MAKTEGDTVIKKYANRRLYNTGTSTYVTLEDLAKMVKKGEEFTVQDAKTGEDITHSVLTQIIFEQESKTGNTLLPIGLSVGLASYPDDSTSPSNLVAQADAAMYAAKKRLRPVASGGKAFDDTSLGVLGSLVEAIDAKDRYTKAHCDIVAEYAVKLAQRMSLPTETQRALHIAGLLHDVGKLVVPDEILKKPAPLTIDEYDVLRGM